jgi:hypothetical protein
MLRVTCREESQHHRIETGVDAAQTDEEVRALGNDHLARVGQRACDSGAPLGRIYGIELARDGKSKLSFCR